MATSLVRVDELALVMMALVGFIGSVVAFFSTRYLAGDTRYRQFFYTLVAFVASVMVAVCADSIFLFLGAWGLSNALMVRLMIHELGWGAARASGMRAGYNFIIGWLFLACGLGILSIVTHSLSLAALVRAPVTSWWQVSALVLVLVSALAQSALWPFHRWLTSSLNSPTPVSAMMHAGLINGGGFLLARFAPLYFQVPMLLYVMFALGMVSALIGTLWMLMQHDVKRMLACSTMGQMGFMVAQCGLGLFSVAIAHVCWHGLFKAYLFLNSGSVLREKRCKEKKIASWVAWLVAVICGLSASYSYAITSDKVWCALDTTLIIELVAFLAGTHYALVWLRQGGWNFLPFTLISTTALGALYGSSVHVIDDALQPLDMMQPQPLNAVYIVGMIVLIAAWYAVFVAQAWRQKRVVPARFLRVYVRIFNASQPAADTVTAHRNDYKYR